MARSNIQIITIARATSKSSSALLVLGVLVGSFSVMLAALGSMRYLGYNADMFDLGNMAQAIASVRRGEPLVFTFSDGPMSRLALHVELFYFLIAPFYALWPDPRLLISLQACLYAGAAFPVYVMAKRRLQAAWPAVAIALIYLLYPIVQTAVLLDIHGDTLGMAMLLFALEALDSRSWKRYWLFVVLALSCKMYVAACIALLGVVMLWQLRERRMGLATLAAGLLYGGFAFFVIRPLFTTADTSSLHRNLNYISFYFGEFTQLMQTWDWRMANAGIVFLPVVLLAWRGWPWLLPGIPIALAALLSTRGGSASYASHHYALVAPFILMATIDGAGRLAAGVRATAAAPRLQKWRVDIALTTGLVLLFNMLLVDTPLNPSFWLRIPGKGLRHTAYGRVERDSVKDTLLHTAIPPQAALASSLYLAPHVADRATLYMVRYEDGQSDRPLSEILPLVDYVVADTLFDIRQSLPGGGFFSLVDAEGEQIREVMRAPEFGLVASTDGLVVFKRGAAPLEALRQEIRSVPDNRTAETTIGGAVELLDAVITPLGGSRVRAEFTWRRAPTMPKEARYVAVSQFDGIADARIVHLPTYMLLPTQQWQAGQAIRETFDVELPAGAPGQEYIWRVGWYDLSNSEAFLTDKQSQVGDSVMITRLAVP